MSGLGYVFCVCLWGEVRAGDAGLRAMIDE